MAEKFDNPNYNPEAGMKYLATHFEMFKPEVAKAMIADAKRKGVKIPPVVEAKARKAGILNSVRVAMNYVNPKFPDLRYAKIVSEMAEAVAKTGGAEGNAAATDIARGSVAAFIIDDLKEAERRLTHELSVFPSWASLDLENKKIYDEALRKTKLKLEAIKRLLPKAKAMVANSVRNADTPEARKIIERAKGRFAAIKDPGQLANVRDDILRGISRSSAIPDDEKDAIEGEVIYLHGQALRKLGFNSVRSTNAVVAKALNAVARNANFRGSVWDRALAVSVRPKFSKGNRVKVVGHPMEDGVRGIVEKTFPGGQVLITTGYDKDGHPYTVQVHQSYLVRNSVVQKAINAVACNAKFRVFLDNGRETEIVATSESSASDKVLQKFKFGGDKAPKVSRVVRLKPVVSGRFVGKANGLEYYVDYTDDLEFAKKYGKDGTNVTEIHINTPYLKDEDGRERRHIVYTWSRGSEWIGDKFKHPDFPDAARAARDLAAKLIRSNPNVAKIGDDTNDWR